MLVLEHNTGKIQYEAAQLVILKDRYDQFWNELELLIKKDLKIEEVFYNAAFIHLAFVNIHPFGDGNGRMSRLLEKWFLAEKLGKRAWYVQSEKYYYKQVNEYSQKKYLLRFACGETVHPEWRQEIKLPKRDVIEMINGRDVHSFRQQGKNILLFG